MLRLPHKLKETIRVAHALRYSVRVREQCTLHCTALYLCTQPNLDSVLTSTLNPVFLPLSKRWVGAEDVRDVATTRIVREPSSIRGRLEIES